MTHPHRVIEDCLGLPRWTVTDCRASGQRRLRHHLAPAADRQHPLGRDASLASGRRVLRLPCKRVRGYQPTTPDVRPRDRRAREKWSAWRFMQWAMFRFHYDLPLVRRALDGDLSGVEQFRAAPRAAAPELEPEPVLGLRRLHRDAGGRPRDPA